MRLQLIAALSLGLCACYGDRLCTAVPDLSAERVPLASYMDHIAHADRPFAVVGDMQRTSFQECVIGREVNDAATRHIIRDLSRARPGLLVIVGDMVFYGASSRHWRWFDWLMQPIRDAQIPVLPALGNHDYFGSDREARHNIALRFPSLATTTHYAITYDRLGLVWLDSNADALSDAEWAEQQRWFVAKLGAFDRDPAVRGVLVFLHHAPFTNSTVVDGNANVQRDIVPAFNRSTKSLAMLTGHAHGYEHFNTQNKEFFVTAGGGGPRGRLHAPRTGELSDIFQGPAPRPFNYLLVHQDALGARVETWGFTDAAHPSQVLETTQLTFAALSPPPTP